MMAGFRFLSMLGFGDEQKRAQEPPKMIEHSPAPASEPAKPAELPEVDLQLSEEDLLQDVPQLSEGDKQRKRVLESMRADINYFDDQLTRSELFATRARDNMKKFKEFLRNSEIELEEISGLKAAVSEKDRSINALAQQVSQLEISSAEKDSELLAEANRIVELREALEEVRTENNELAETVDQRQSELRGLMRQRDQLDTRANGLASELNEIAAEKQVLEETAERLERELTEQLALNSNLSKQVNEMTINLERVSANRDKFNADLRDSKERIAELKSELLELRSSNESMREEMQSQERYSADRLRSREAEIYSLKSEIDSLHSQITVRTQMFNQAQNEMNSAKAVAKVARGTAEEVERRLVEANLLRESEQKALMDANEEISEVNARYARLLQELEQTKQENAGLRRFQQIYEENARRAVNLGIKEEPPVATSSGTKTVTVVRPNKQNTH
ncbi:MAG: hypothetical protein OXR62_16355 [Ahrensia sp.]|nr:hypothetical protein [Ahrensia sp.]